uniref:Uncharacterized protein n=1 Tax=Cacopsylla melanoneura TaxID=428564 RepID=A0A8D9BMA9_9HEMI
MWLRLGVATTSRAAKPTRAYWVLTPPTTPWSITYPHMRDQGRHFGSPTVAIQVRGDDEAIEQNKDSPPVFTIEDTPQAPSIMDTPPPPTPPSAVSPRKKEKFSPILLGVVSPSPNMNTGAQVQLKL